MLDEASIAVIKVLEDEYLKVSGAFKRAVKAVLNCGRLLYSGHLVLRHYANCFHLSVDELSDNKFCLIFLLD